MNVKKRPFDASTTLPRRPSKNQPSVVCPETFLEIQNCLAHEPNLYFIRTYPHNPKWNRQRHAAAPAVFFSSIYDCRRQSAQQYRQCNLHECLQMAFLPLCFNQNGACNFVTPKFRHNLKSLVRLTTSNSITATHDKTEKSFINIYHRQYFSWMQLFYLFWGLRLLCACFRLRAPRNANSMPQVCRRWSSIRWRVSSASGRSTVSTKTKTVLWILGLFTMIHKIQEICMLMLQLSIFICYFKYRRFG